MGERVNITNDQNVRAAVVLGALAAVSALAIVFRSEAAGGALIGLLGLAGSFLFRGKVQPPGAE